MTTLTAEQTLDLQGDLSIGADESVFTNDELQRLYDRSASDFNTAVYFGWRQILAASAKWVDYQVAQTKVSRSVAFDHIKEMVDFWAAESRTNSDQLRSVGMRGVPTHWKPIPADRYTGHRRGLRPRDSGWWWR